MTLIWKGKYENEKQLPVVNLPSNAIRFKEPKTPAQLNLVASLFLIPVVFIVIGAIYLKKALGFEFNIGLGNIIYNWGALLAFSMILPHEFLHAIAFPKKSEVELWYSLENLMAFVFSTAPMTKTRFLYVSLLPNIIFGFLPLAAWIFMPSHLSSLSGILLSFSVWSLCFGIGDFLNVFNTITQMPKNSITQLSGFHSYWYMPQEN